MIEQYNDLPEGERKLFIALMVADVTIACIEPFLTEAGKELMAGQITAVRDAYKTATGDEPFQLRRGP